jgi:predicted nucleotidyltransferase
MDNEELLNKNKLLEEELQKIKNELIDTKEHLKKYTAPIRNKAYYENHKQELLEKMKSNPIPTDKRKEYNKKYYLKKKDNNSENIKK